MITYAEALNVLRQFMEWRNPEAKNVKFPNQRDLDESMALAIETFESIESKQEPKSSAVIKLKKIQELVQSIDD